MAVGKEAGAELEENHRAGAEDAEETEEAKDIRNAADVEKGDGASSGAVKEITKGGKVAADGKSKNPKAPKAPKVPMVSFVRLFAFATPYDYVLMAIGALGAGIHGAALPVLFLFFGKLINGLGGAVDDVGHTVNKYALYFVYLGIVSFGTGWLEVAFWMHTGERQTSKMREKYLEALLRQDVAFFDTEANTGDFVNTIASDPLMVQDAISEKVGNFIHYNCTFIAGFIVGFTISWRIAILTFAVVPLIATAGAFYMVVLTGATAKASEAYSKAGIVVEEATSQVRTVYSFVGENKFVQAYDDALKNTAKLGARGGFAKGIGMGCTFCTLFFCWALLLWYGGVLVRRGTINGGDTISAIFAVIVGSMSLGQAMPNLSAFGRGQAAAYKIFQTIGRQPTINKLNENAQKPTSVDGLIELRNVDFSYPSRPETFIFKNFSLTIPPGKTIAIVGNSGSGKSTIVSLIERFYDPIAGEVLLDGQNLRTLDLKWLRGQIGLVNQEPALFATSIATNMLYGKENATKEEIDETAKAANAMSFIQQLPLGFQTQVGEKGVQLSGGQKQRVAIARAMLKDPKILLLDEATSALDTGSEQVVQEALDRLMMGRTTVVVAHRLSTVRDADAIAVVQDGRIVEMGTHDDLISTENGAYSTLVRLQEQAATVAGGAPSGSGLRSGRRSLDRLSPHDSEGLERPRTSSLTRSAHPVSGDSTRKEEINSTNNEVDKETESAGSLKRLFAMSRPDSKYVLAGTLGSMLAGCINPSYAFIIASVVTVYYSGSGSHMKSEISKYALILVGLGIIAPFIYVLQHYSLAIAGERLIQQVRVKMFTHILRNELGWFDEDENNSAQIAARLSSDATNVRAAIGDRISMIMQNLTLLVIAYTIGFILQWKMTLVMLAVFPVLAVCSFADKALLKGFSGDQAKAHAQATRVAGESVANIRTVAAFNAEKKVQELFIEQLRGPAKNSFVRGHVAGCGYGLSQCFLYCSYALGLWYAGKLVSSGDASFNNVFKVFMILVVTAVAASETLTLSPDLVKGGQAVKSVFKVLDRNTKIEPDDPEGGKVDKIKGDIQLKNVQFAYPSRPDVVIFKNLNLKVSAGRSLALVGASGSGKSSVIALIERYYDPASGEVLIDGKDIRTYNLKSIRQHIALVQQEPALFNTTIYENIMYGRDGASEAEVLEAAKAANAHNFISALPDGYKTSVGDRGVQLSGGQKQRVAIARAVLKDPAILLLDEATSALDAGSEKIVQNALDKLMKGRSTIIVAHRLSTIRGADSIAVVQDGTILEEGTHSQLLAQGGGYSRLINLQNRHQSVPASAH